MDQYTATTDIIIIGGAGDLSKRKLLPALFDLYIRGQLPEHFRILGIARTERDDIAYRKFITDAVAASDIPYETEAIERFLLHCNYLIGSFTDASLYDAISSWQSDGNEHDTVFYLAVPPEHYADIFTMIHTHGLATCTIGGSCTRILVEKPFGNDYRSAAELDALLAQLYHESQVYRIDHYLAKEAIQNILSFRFANTLFSRNWNNETIASISIHMSETVDVAHRGVFYDHVGALRDVGQNHLLQLLALITMHEPASFSASDIQNARAEILEKLIPFSADTIKTQYQRSQYHDYQATTGVADDSTTETAFRMTCFLDDPAWTGVPITITAGKALAAAGVTVSITFKDAPTALFGTAISDNTSNTIELTIDPQPAIALTLNTKAPGFGYTITAQTLPFVIDSTTDTIKNAYEKVLRDCLVGDQTLFISSREIAAQWKFITPILEQQHLTPLTQYAPGTSITSLFTGE